MGGRSWTVEETDFLKEKWGKLQPKMIAENLGRSSCAVSKKAGRLRLGRFIYADEKKLYAPGVLKAFGMCSSRRTLRRWERNGLKIYKKRINKQSFETIDIDTFWEWANEHRELLDFSKLEKYALGKEPRWVDEARKNTVKKGREHWSEAEKSRLKMLLKTQKYNVSEIAIMMGRSEASVKGQMQTSKLKERPVPHEKKAWSSEEVALIKEMNEKGFNYYEIAEKVGRSYGSVWCKIHNL